MITLTPEQEADRTQRLQLLDNCFKHNNDVRRLLLYGGSRSGKTFRGLRKVLKRAVYYPGSRHLVARDTFTALRNAIILDTMPKLLRLYYPQLYQLWCNGGMNNSTNIFTLPNGSEIHFRAIGNEQEVEKLKKEVEKEKEAEVRKQKVRKTVSVTAIILLALAAAGIAVFFATRKRKVKQ